MLKFAPISAGAGQGMPASLEAPETIQILTPADRVRIRAAWQAIEERDLCQDEPLPRLHPLEVQSKSQILLHARHRKQRWHIVNALNNGEEDLRKRAFRLGYCGHTPTLRQKGTSILACLQRCRDRLCPLCAEHRGKAAAAKSTDLVKTMNAPRFLTLTTQGKKDDLFFRIRHLVCAFNKLRQTEEWKSWVKGGIWALEVTWNAKAETWHPHLHIIADGDYVPHAKLKQLWHRITGDSYIVHVRAVHDRQKDARYIATYVSKPFDVLNWPAERIREYASTLHGARMINAFGTCHNAARIDADDVPEVESPSRHLIHGTTLARWARKSKVARHVQEIVSRLGATHAIAVEQEPLPSPVPVEDWELRYISSVCTALANIVGPDLPSHFDVDLLPERCLSRHFPPELARREESNGDGYGCNDPHTRDVDLLTLFDGHDKSFRQTIPEG